MSTPSNLDRPPPLPPTGAPSSNWNMSGNGGRPSDDRRKYLNEELSVPLVSNFFPIERYYDAADKVYESFQTLYKDILTVPSPTPSSVAAAAAGSSSNPSAAAVAAAVADDRLDDAYVYGKRYCLFCIDGIPTHNYYNATKNRGVRNKHHKQVNQVIEQLETVVKKMDQQETFRKEIIRQERERLRLEQERLRLERERIQQEKLDQFNARILQQKQQSRQQHQQQNQQQSSSAADVQMSALEKLKLLAPPAPSSPQSQSSSQMQQGGARIRVDPSGQEPISATPTTGSSRYRLLDDSEDDEEKFYNTEPLPPPMLPPASGSVNGGIGNSLPPPPSYESISSSASSSRQFLGPAASSPSSAVDQKYPNEQQYQQQQQRRPKKKSLQPMQSRQEQYRQDYIRYQQMGKIQVTGIDTYQGRTDSSTNGCTVISALVAANHLRATSSMGITNEMICRIIDSQCGPILRQIRGKLGLGGHALIIPSDVHDHLVDAKILSQADFEGVAGGNILDEEHMTSFVKLLSVGDSGNGAYAKAAATLFFREHVVSIVKIVNTRQQQVWYDLVDSLPGTVPGNNGRCMATRTRCHDLESLYVLLRWYASRKLSSSNCTYCDRNAWDDSMADFDPRVFQGFVWMIKEKQ